MDTQHDPKDAQFPIDMEIGLDWNCDQTISDPGDLIGNTNGHASEDDQFYQQPEPFDGAGHDNMNVFSTSEAATLPGYETLIKSEQLDDFGYSTNGADHSGNIDSNFVHFESTSDVLTKNVRQKHVCGSCSRSFSSSSKLREHHQLFHKRDIENRPYKCVICNLAFHYCAQISSHVKIHTIKSKCMDCVCGKSFSQAPVLSLHMRMNCNENLILSSNEHNLFKPQQMMPSMSFPPRLFKCAVCQKTFMSLVNLQKHILLHEGVKLFRCALCGMTFTSWNGLISHKTSYHLPSIARNDRYPCQTGRFWSKITTDSHKCSICDKHFYHQSTLSHHIRSHTYTLHMCSMCTEMFSTSQQLRNHMSSHRGTSESHAEDKWYKCHLCDKSYLYSAGLRRHLISHTSAPSKSFKSSDKRKRHIVVGKRLELCKCSICGAELKSKYYCRIHMKSRHDVYTCPVCLLPFPTRYKRDKHRVVHEGAELFKCPVCYAAFETKYKLEMHKALHTGVKPHKCLQCDKSYTTRMGFRYHVMAYHQRNDQGGNSYVCNTCNAVFESEYKLRVHNKSHTGTDMAQIKCEQDDDSYVTKGEAMKQERRYPYSCNDCDEVCTNTYALKKHRSEAHNGVALYRCMECDESFSSAEKLRKHRAVHTGIDPFQCTICGQTFQTKHQFMKHKVAHGEQPFRCKLCGETFTSSEYRRKHMAFHTGINPFTCSVCGESYKSKHLLTSCILLSLGDMLI